MLGQGGEAFREGAILLCQGLEHLDHHIAGVAPRMMTSIQSEADGCGEGGALPQLRRRRRNMDRSESWLDSDRRYRLASGSETRRDGIESDGALGLGFEEQRDAIGIGLEAAKVLHLVGDDLQKHLILLLDQPLPSDRQG